MKSSLTDESEYVIIILIKVNRDMSTFGTRRIREENQRDDQQLICEHLALMVLETRKTATNCDGGV